MVWCCCVGGVEEVEHAADGGVDGWVVVSCGWWASGCCASMRAARKGRAEWCVFDVFVGEIANQGNQARAWQGIAHRKHRQVDVGSGMCCASSKGETKTNELLEAKCPVNAGDGSQQHDIDLRRPLWDVILTNSRVKMARKMRAKEEEGEDWRCRRRRRRTPRLASASHFKLDGSAHKPAAHENGVVLSVARMAARTDLL